MTEVEKNVTEETFKEETNEPAKEEIAVIWERLDVKGERYLSIKIKLDEETKQKLLNESQFNFKAFKNKAKKQGASKPDFVAFKNTQKKL